MKKFTNLFTILIFSSFVFFSCNTIKGPLSQEQAIKIAKEHVPNEPISEIINYDNLSIEFSNYQGNDVWQITFNTHNDGVLGPIILYVNYKDASVYGPLRRD